MENKNVLVIINPCSGKGKGVKIEPKIKSALESAGFSCDVIFTERSGHATELASNASQDMVVAVGGDGTLNEVITGLVENKTHLPTLGYIPLGSTNDFAKSMKIPFCWKKALDVIISGAPQTIDICKFNDKYFSYVAAYGMFAKTSCSVSQKIKNRLGHLAYILFGIKEIFKKHNYKINIEVDGETIQDSYAFLGLGNTKSIGGLLRFKDEVVQMSDGLFEVLLVKYPKSLRQLTRMIKRFNTSEWVDDGLELCYAKEVKIYNNGEMLWSLDGEKYLLNGDAVVSIVPNAINIITEKKV